MAARKRPAAVLGAGHATTTTPQQSPACCKRSRTKIRSTAEYEEETCLGEGGFGCVLMARHKATRKIVAIKFLNWPDGSHQPPDAAELLREGRFLEACDGNPYVVGFEESGLPQKLGGVGGLRGPIRPVEVLDGDDLAGGAVAHQEDAAEAALAEACLLVVVRAAPDVGAAPLAARRRSLGRGGVAGAEDGSSRSLARGHRRRASSTDEQLRLLYVEGDARAMEARKMAAVDRRKRGGG